MIIYNEKNNIIEDKNNIIDKDDYKRKVISEDMLKILKDMFLFMKNIYKG